MTTAVIDNTVLSNFAHVVFIVRIATGEEMRCVRQFAGGLSDRAAAVLGQCGGGEVPVCPHALCSCPFEPACPPKYPQQPSLRAFVEVFPSDPIYLTHFAGVSTQSILMDRLWVARPILTLLDPTLYRLLKLQRRRRRRWLPFLRL